MVNFIGGNKKHKTGYMTLLLKVAVNAEDGLQEQLANSVFIP